MQDEVTDLLWFADETRSAGDTLPGGSRALRRQFIVSAWTCMVLHDAGDWHAQVPLPAEARRADDAQSMIYSEFR